MQLNNYQKKLLAAAAIGKPYGDLNALDNLRRRGLIEINGGELTVTLTDAGRKALQTP